MKKKIFQKKNQINKKKIILLIFFLSIVFVIFFLFFKKNNHLEFFTISEFTNPFYIIPKDKEGIKVPNLDKKSLHQNYKDFNDISIINDPLLKYSIQLFSSTVYQEIIDKYNFYKFNEKKFDKNLHNNLERIYIFVLNANSNPEFFLLYKNFESRKLAINYCKKNILSLNKCIIVNAQNID